MDSGSRDSAAYQEQGVVGMHMQSIGAGPVGSLYSMRNRPVVVSGQPGFAFPDSQLVSASQIYELECRQWFDRIGFRLMMDRKAWEYAYILRAISIYARVDGGRGLGFGCGKEFIPAILAADGAAIVATDFVTDLESSHGWEARSIEDLFFGEHISRELFDQRVVFRHQDMTAINDNLRGFDFIWSTGALEHIGSHANGLRFIEEAMACLKPGGIAAHTTEFTISSDTVGQDHPELSFYCRKDIEELAMRLTSAGHRIVLNFDRGTTAADTHVDVTPYHGGRTLAAHFESHVITSVGLIIQRGE